MASEADKQTAIKLQEAKQDFEARLEEAVRQYESQVKGPLEFDLSLRDEAEDVDPEEKHADLRRMVRSLVEAFHAQGVVYQTGVRVRKIEAIDSDADGRASLNVMYDHPGY